MIASKAVPVGWKRIKLLDCMELIYGSSLPKKKRVEGEVPVFGSNGVTDFHNEHLVEGPGIIVGRKGSIGLVQWTDKDFWPIDTTYYVKVKDEADLRWVFYKLQTLALDRMNTASGIPGLNRNEVYNLNIFVPPLSEQTKIAGILSKVDEEIEQVERVIAQTERLKKGLMQKLFTKGIGHAKFKKTELGEIPVEWEVVRLEEIAQVERGKFSHRPRNAPQFYGGKVPFIQTADVVNSNGKIGSYKQTLNQDGLAISKYFPKGTIVITIAANIGDTGILEFDSCFPDSLVGIRVNESMNSIFLEYFLRTQKQYLNDIATQSAQKNLSLEKLKPLLVVRPVKGEQDEISSVLSAVEEKITFYQKLKSYFLKLKKGLMSDLLNGKVRFNKQ